MYMHILLYPQGAWLTLPPADADCQKSMVVFNSLKCWIRQPQIAFYGAVFTPQGMQPGPAKIQALQDLPTPDSQVKLQSFLGLINYLQPFIPSLSTKTTFLHEQLAKWDWNPSTDAAFQCLKDWICQTLPSATLAYYNRSKPVVVQTDVSEYGLGTVLIQNGCPITFASKSLTDVETHYANIERECLSVCFGLKKFHTYIYGRHVTIQNHKTAGNDPAKPIHVAPPTSAHASAYAEVWLYHPVKPGKEMVLANNLSHFSSHKESHCCHHVILKW